MKLMIGIVRLKNIFNKKIKKQLQKNIKKIY